MIAAVIMGMLHLLCCIVLFLGVKEQLGKSGEGGERKRA